MHLQPGGCIGGLITFAINFSADSGSVNDATYFTFIGIMTAGSLIALVLVVPPVEVVRSDGTKAAQTDAVQKTAREEVALAMHVPTERFMRLLSPLILGSNWFYTYNFNGVNAELFNARTRGFNSALFWGSQMLASWSIGRLLDGRWWPARGRGRRSRAILGGGIVLTVWLLQNAYALLLQYFHYGSDCPSKAHAGCSGGRIDLTHAAWLTPGLLFLLMGFTDALLQSYCLWMIGTHCNEPGAMGRYAGCESWPTPTHDRSRPSRSAGHVAVARGRAPTSDLLSAARCRARDRLQGSTVSGRRLCVHDRRARSRLWAAAARVRRFQRGLHATDHVPRDGGHRAHAQR